MKYLFFRFYYIIYHAKTQRFSVRFFHKKTLAYTRVFIDNSLSVFRKLSKTQERQGARGKPKGAYIDVRNRGLPQRNAVFRSGFLIFRVDNFLAAHVRLQHFGNGHAAVRL